MERIEQKRLVVKIGTSVIVKNGNGLDLLFMDDIARQVAYIKKNFDIQTIIVSSGAVGSGRVLVPDLTAATVDKQVAAIYGQPELMDGWRRAFAKQRILAGEALLKDEDIPNFRNPAFIASRYGVVVVNGPDAAYDPATEGQILSVDNDRLARYVAFITGAKTLLMLTEAPGMLDRNKRIIDEIAGLEDLDRIVYFEKTQNGRGGPEFKVWEARRFLTDATKVAYIAGARVEDVIVRIARGERVGTRVTCPLQGFFNI